MSHKPFRKERSPSHHVLRESWGTCSQLCGIPISSQEREGSVTLQLDPFLIEAIVESTGGYIVVGKDKS